MPSLSPSLVSGRILQLLCKEGDQVESYQHFMTVSTSTLLKIADNSSNDDNNDKQLDIEIMEDMYVAKYLVNTNDIVQVNDPIALLCEYKDDIDEVKAMDKKLYQQFRKSQWQGYIK